MAKRSDYKMDASNGVELSLDDRIIEMKAKLALAKQRLKKLRQEKLLSNLAAELDRVETQIMDENTVTMTNIEYCDMPVCDDLVYS